MILKIELHETAAQLPEYATTHAAGFDLRASESGYIAPGGRLLVSTGLRMEIPLGYEGQVRPRSGLAAKHGVTVLNAPGTIDADYRGVVKVLLVNHDPVETFHFQTGDRIAQMVIAAVQRPAVEQTFSPLSTTQRGTGGFGSTGV